MSAEDFTEEALTLAFLVQASDKEIDQYRCYIELPLVLHAHPYWSAANRTEWVLLEKYALFLREASDEKRKDAFTRLFATVVQSKPLGKPLDIENPKPLKRPSAEVIEISDSDSDSAAPGQPAPPPKKHVKHATVKIEPGTEPPTSIPSESVVPSVILKRTKNGRIFITKRESVECVIELDRIPKRWSVDEVDTAYILDLSNTSNGPARTETFTGRPKGFDAFLKAEDQDSWGHGTNGSTTRETKLIVLGGLPSRRSSHKCNGGLCCKFFNPTLLEGYEHTDLDMTLTQEIFARDRAQNKNDSGPSIAVTASFYRLIKAMKCKKAGCMHWPCRIEIVGPSDDGKLKFIGCSKWRMEEQYKHLYAALPSAVNEGILAQYMAGMAITSDDVDEYNTDSCAHFAHPRHGKLKHCSHTHFRDGKLVVGEMVHHPCLVKKIVYTSKDPNVKVLVVIFRGRHSHPPWPMEKPTQEAKDDLAKCLETMGPYGATGGKLNKSTTTRALIGSDLSVKHPAYRDTRRLRDAVLSRRESSTPAGLLWAGILDQYVQDQQLPIDNQYIHVIRMEGSLKLAFCLDAELAEVVHKVRYLVPDFTFKRIVGNINEWEVAVWLDDDHERVSVSRIYCNRSTKQAFTYIFEGFFMAVEKITGHPVRFKAFDPEGEILSIHFDMEAAQVQGFALALLKLIKGCHPEEDPDVIVRYVLKLCSIHFTRSTDPLVGAVGQETVDYLNRIRGLKSHEDIETWHNYCRNHENKKLQDWYKHKIQYSWLLPGYNKSLSLFPAGFWSQTPNHTNLVESAHVATNRETGIKLSPLEAIQRMRAFDRERAVSIAAARETCIPINRNNDDRARMSRTVGRSARRTLRRNEHSERENGIAEAKKQLGDATKSKSSLTLRLKELQAEKKTMGRAPRNSHSINRYGNAAGVPRVSSTSSAAGNDSDGTFEIVEDETMHSTRSSLPNRASSSASDFNEVEMVSGPSSAPPSSSSGFDLVSRASGFDSDYDDFDGAFNNEYPFDEDLDANWDEGMAGEDAGDDPHVGHFLLGAPGFDLDEFLAACGVKFA
ncbi:hypothetical protein B0H17DRAFT_1215189 [Mycena rosella]|uniref:Uncharacterized protein n=1 Tax=Mycena rosella TaxID=1033263 RepID=A0AAD7G365_MYCRO|nr:hypothetical protein B0H17DRAFT_1215183 [Mycena rosella]KAJ7651804.1 hypothetical protein B0H17DRAFT_1215189 [Mycena rosella]